MTKGVPGERFQVGAEGVWLHEAWNRGEKSWSSPLGTHKSVVIAARPLSSQGQGPRASVVL